MSIQIYNDIKEIVLDVIGASAPTDIIEGTVYNLDPFRVEVDGDSELYPSSSFIVPEYLTKHKVDIKFKGKFPLNGLKFQGNLTTDITQYAEFTGQCNDDELNFEGELEIDNSLEVGDPVILLKCQAGQKLLVLDREVKTE